MGLTWLQRPGRPAAAAFPARVVQAELVKQLMRHGRQRPVAGFCRWVEGGRGNVPEEAEGTFGAASRGAAKTFLADSHGGEVRVAHRRGPVLDPTVRVSTLVRFVLARIDDVADVDDSLIREHGEAVVRVARVPAGIRQWGDKLPVFQGDARRNRRFAVVGELDGVELDGLGVEEPDAVEREAVVGGAAGRGALGPTPRRRESRFLEHPPRTLIVPEVQDSGRVKV